MKRVRLSWPVRIVVLVGLLVIALYAGSMIRVEKPPAPLPQKALAVPPSDVEVQVLNESAVPGLAVRVARFLRENGYDVVETGNGNRVGLAVTEVVVRGDDMEKGTRVARSLQCESVRSEKAPDELVDVTVFVGKDIDRLVALPQ